MLPEALFWSAADANGARDRFAHRDRTLAKQFAIRFARLRPPIDGGHWTNVFRRRSGSNDIEHYKCAHARRYERSFSSAPSAASISATATRHAAAGYDPVHGFTQPYVEAARF
jgi:hypothetical protein